MKLIEETFPTRDMTIAKRFHAANANFTIGHEDNLETTSTQLNFSTVGLDLEDSLKDFGHAHIDGRDNLDAYTAMFSLSHLPTDYFRFNLTSIRATCITSTFAALVFKGCHPHFGCGAGL
ncbi:hypothetical protein G7Y89_g4777 [Cudoniella acicularis]|uniref:Uncharacterized protein n=1 Tax=Cudoniella acicularis TaxID=354080 RepID=A0A8H4RQ74_9HELO|nr:hypothetical protein G7Y89_g4777 [Cudoniella acicularis]